MKNNQNEVNKIIDQAKENILIIIKDENIEDISWKKDYPL